MSVLSALQRSIEALHDIHTALEVEQYVVDPNVLEELPGAREGIPEQLLIRQDSEGLELALYVDPQILALLEADDPHRQLHDGNLEPYCVALEGVSHFVFLAYRAQVGRPVTPLELEIQAEVDKFIHAWLLLARQGVGWSEAGRGLARGLFSRYLVREEVPPEEVDRYHAASRAAEGFCRRLLQRYGRSGTQAQVRHVTREARQYYRQGLADKMKQAA